MHPKAAYFTRGSGHTQFGTYTEDSADYQAVLDRLLRKWETIKQRVPRPLVDGAGGEIGIVSLGSGDSAIQEALAVLRGRGVAVDYLRVRAFPFGEEVERFLAAHRLLFVVEQNRDAQLRSLLTLETAVEKAKLRSLLHYSGLPVSSSFIVEGVLAEIERARTDWRASAVEAGSARQVRGSAGAVLALYRAQFAAGQMSRLRLLDAEEAYIEAEQGSLAASVNERFALGELETALHHCFLVAAEKR